MNTPNTQAPANERTAARKLVDHYRHHGFFASDRAAANELLRLDDENAALRAALQSSRSGQCDMGDICPGCPGDCPGKDACRDVNDTNKVLADHYLRATTCGSGQDGGDAGGEPFGQVAIYRAKHPNHADRHEFYPWPHPPYLDNASECVTVYRAPQPAAVPAPNLSCKSTQARLAAQWGYVPAAPALVPLRRIPSDGDAFVVLSNGNGYRIEGVRAVEDEFCRINGLTVGGDGGEHG